MAKVLVVDDDLLIRYSLLKALQGMRLEVRAVPTGEEALRELRSTSADLCFLDVRLPDMNGIDLQKEIRDLFPHMKTVLMTGSYVDDHLRKGIEAADSFLMKPFNIVQVKSLVQNLLGRGHTPAGLNDNTVPRERRRHQRELIRRPCRYSVLSRDRESMECSGEVIDITDTGMGMYTNRLFESGRIIQILWDDLEKHGIVRWGIPAQETDHYRLGIEFL
ncbi:MAG: response regulator [bacterium]